MQLDKDSVTVAEQLIGCGLYVREADGSLTGGMITETEAYASYDAASHSYRGETPRTSIMFGPAGFVYVYFTYGMHWCMNIVTGPSGSGEAVLIRAIQPEKGIETIRERRNFRSNAELTNGPAKVCQALSVTGADNGARVNDGRFVLIPRKKGFTPRIATTPRIGITRDTDRLWRFVLTD